MDLELSMKERAALRAIAREGRPTQRAAAAILLARDDGLSYRQAAEAVGRKRQYAHQVCKAFVDRGRLGSPPLGDPGFDRTPYSERKRGGASGREAD